MAKHIEIRMHHLLCIPRFYSGGYDKRFAENMKDVCLAIRKNPEIKIKLLDGKLDSLCKKCPHGRNGKCTQSRGMGTWVVSHDKKVAKHMKLKPSTHTAKEIFNLAMDVIDDKALASFCKGCVFVDDCNWVKINNSFRKDLNKN